MTKKAKIVMGRPRGVAPQDTIIGQKIRVRRVEMSISQQELGAKLGVSFQQVQKYEKGVNRISAGRLQQIAHALEVPMSFFFATNTKGEREVESLIFSDPSFSLRLMRAYIGIGNKETQRALVSLMESIAADPHHQA